MSAGGTNQHYLARTYYEDTARRLTISADLNSEGDGLLKSRTTMDELNRPVLTQQSEDGSSYTIYALKAYDLTNRISYASGAMKGTPAAPVSSATDSWTRVTSDLLGRVTGFWEIAPLP